MLLSGIKDYQLKIEGVSSTKDVALFILKLLSIENKLVDLLGRSLVFKILADCFTPVLADLNFNADLREAEGNNYCLVITYGTPTSKYFGMLQLVLDLNALTLSYRHSDENIRSIRERLNSLLADLSANGTSAFLDQIARFGSVENFTDHLKEYLSWLDGYERDLNLLLTTLVTYGVELSI
jgi:hypothetical protein